MTLVLKDRILGKIQVIQLSIPLLSASRRIAISVTRVVFGDRGRVLLVLKTPSSLWILTPKTILRHSLNSKSNMRPRSMQQEL